jgi:ribosomal protein S18 acetylase RimI-like enzyme
MSRKLALEHSVYQTLHNASTAAQQCADEADAVGEPEWAKDLHRDAIALQHLAQARFPGARLLGIPLPAPWNDQTGVLHVRPYDNASQPLWETVYALGLLFQQEIGYSRNPFRADQRDHHFACLWADAGRAAGVLVYQEEQERYRWLDEIDKPDSGKAEVYGDNSFTLRFEGVWVARDFRNRGIAKRLALAAAEEHGIEPERIIHSQPLSTAGGRFAQSLAGGRVRVTTEVQDRWSGRMIET